MLTEEKNIDQLFQKKLGDYQKTPPTFIWNQIESKLDEQKRTRRIVFIKRFGVAAALILAFFAGWWLSNPAVPTASDENKITGTVIQKNEIVNEINKIQPQNQDVATDDSANKTSERVSVGQSNKSGKQYKPSISSIASFAPNTSFLNKISESSLVDQKDSIPVDAEKEFLSHFNNNLKLIKQLSAWVSSFNKSTDTISKNKQLFRLNKQFIADDRSLFSPTPKNETFNKGGKWTLSAGVAPVFTSQKQGGNYYPGQSTSAENSISGALMAGYKIRKRIVVKSGIIYSQTRQVTKNMNYSSVVVSPGPILGEGVISRAYTPSGPVIFNKSSITDGLDSYNAHKSVDYQSELNQDFGYIEIPVQATYKIIDHKFDVGVTGGISTNILVGNKANLFANGQRVSSGATANLRDFTYSGAVGLELGYDISNRITITVEPRIKHFLNSLSSNKAVDFKPYQLDIVTGITYSFN